MSLAAINVITGANNAGKSTILRALHALQNGGRLDARDVRIGTNSCQIDISMEDVVNVPEWRVGAGSVSLAHAIHITSQDRKSSSMHWNTTVYGDQSRGGSSEIPNIDPSHFVVPYFSNRKVAGYSEDVREQSATTINSSMSNLSARLSRIANPHFPDFQEYARHCEEILGFVVTSIPSPNGQRPGVYLPNRQSIDIEFMGEGVPNIVQLLASLASSEGKLFLIEEPENDIHPAALRSLLELIVKSSKKNQFVISTHSNIVVTHLCGTEDSRLWRVQSPKGLLPYDTKVEEVEDSAGARLQVLNDLGYSLADLGMWSGYLIFEEASAEFIIRAYLIPMFVPELKRIRTISASGVSNVGPTFADLNRLALFLHLEPAYRSRVWVIVDGDDAGKNALEALRTRYGSWPAESFTYFEQPQFERYYPSEFSLEVNEVLAIKDAKVRRQRKDELVRKVVSWLDEDVDRAKQALSQSASEVIEHLVRVSLLLEQATAGV